MYILVLVLLLVIVHLLCKMRKGIFLDFLKIERRLKSQADDSKILKEVACKEVVYNRRVAHALATLQEEVHKLGRSLSTARVVFTLTEENDPMGKVITELKQAGDNARLVVNFIKHSGAVVTDVPPELYRVSASAGISVENGIVTALLDDVTGELTVSDPNSDAPPAYGIIPVGNPVVGIEWHLEEFVGVPTEPIDPPADDTENQSVPSV